MTGKIQQELQQNKPVPSLEEEAYLNVQRTANVLLQGLTEVLRGHDLTPTQYNVLRILRGVHPQRHTCSEVGARLVDRTPDVTRLLDRLEARGLISRERPAHNRRQVITRVTGEGLRLLAELDVPVVESHRSLAGHLGERQLKTLNRLLEALRGEQV